MTPDIIMPATMEDYEKSGSKFVTMPFPVAEYAANIGKSIKLDIEMGKPDWETQGSSIKFPVTVIEAGPDQGKEDKLVAGVEAKGIWKFKEIMGALGVEVKNKAGKPAFDPAAVMGKKAVGVWTIIEGVNQTTGNPTFYPKLQAIVAKK